MVYIPATTLATDFRLSSLSPSISSSTDLHKPASHPLQKVSLFYGSHEKETKQLHLDWGGFLLLP